MAPAPGKQASRTARDARPDSAAIAFDDVVDQLRTGDLLLFHGENRVSREVEIATGSPFSHVAMIIRHGARDAPMIWQAGPGGIVKDPSTGTRHDGAQLGDLREALTLMEDPQYHDTAYLRRLMVRRPDGFDDRALAAVADLDGRPFPSILKMVENWVLGKLHIASPERTLFCAELVSLSYMKMGMLPDAPPPNAYAPKEFSDRNKNLKLQLGGRLGRQVEIKRPPVDKTQPVR